MQGIAPFRILAVSFTRKASAELKERLGRWGIQGVRACTFHSFCLVQILLKYGKEAGYTAKPEIISNDNRLMGFLSEAMR